MKYKFSNESARVMVRRLRNLHKDANKEERIKIKIGKCFKKVDFSILV